MLMARKSTRVAEELQKKWQKFSDLQLDAINNQIDPTIRYQIGVLAKELGKPELPLYGSKRHWLSNPIIVLRPMR